MKKREIRNSIIKNINGNISINCLERIKVITDIIAMMGKDDVTDEDISSFVYIGNLLFLNYNQINIINRIAANMKYGK